MSAKEIDFAQPETAFILKDLPVARIESSEHIRFNSFNTEQEVWVRRQMERCGLPLGNVTRIDYSVNKPGEEDVLGRAHQSNGKIELFKSLDWYPKIAQAGTLLHELAHQNSPFIENHSGSYKNGAERDRAADHAMAIAAQTLETGKFLNGYHRWLANEFRAGRIDSTRLAEETHAIMIELRFTNPAHLRQVEAAQLAALEKQYKGDRFVSIRYGVDQTLLGLIASVNDRQELDQHIKNYRASFR